MALDPSKIYDLAADLLDCVVAGFEDAYDDYAAPFELPARRYVHAGETAWDCPQVTVTVPDESGVEHSFPGGDVTIPVCSPPRHVQLQVSINRCVPPPRDDGTPPTVTELDEAARITLTDLWTLAYVLWSTYKTDGCWGGACATVLFGPVTVNGPQGGHTAVVADVFVLLT